MKWTMKDGTQIEISQMTTSHIKNCINLMERNIMFALNKEMSLPWENTFSVPALFQAKYDALIAEYNKRLENENTDKRAD